MTLLVRDEKKCFLLRDDLKKKFPHIEVRIISLNLCDELQVTTAFENHQKYFGVSPSAIIHTAAVQKPIGTVWEVSAAEWAATIEINLTASFLITKIAIQYAIKNTAACSIVLFSGGGSCYARPYFSAYGVAKTGVLRLVETTAEELKLEKLDQQIQINALAPGAVFSNMTREIVAAGKEAGDVAKTPEEAVKLCLFLSDREKNKGLNGRLIHVKEPYWEYSNKVVNIQATDKGLLRRVPIHEK